MQTYHYKNMFAYQHHQPIFGEFYALFEPTPKRMYANLEHWRLFCKIIGSISDERLLAFYAHHFRPRVMQYGLYYAIPIATTASQLCQQIEHMMDRIHYFCFIIKEDRLVHELEQMIVSMRTLWQETLVVRNRMQKLCRDHKVAVQYSYSDTNTSTWTRVDNWRQHKMVKQDLRLYHSLHAMCLQKDCSSIFCKTRHCQIQKDVFLIFVDMWRKMKGDLYHTHNLFSKVNGIMLQNNPWQLVAFDEKEGSAVLSHNLLLHPRDFLHYQQQSSSTSYAMKARFSSFFPWALEGGGVVVLRRKCGPYIQCRRQLKHYDENDQRIENKIQTPVFPVMTCSRKRKRKPYLRKRRLSKILKETRKRRKHVHHRQKHENLLWEVEEYDEDEDDSSLYFWVSMSDN